jgi:hypothetical protein
VWFRGRNGGRQKSRGARYQRYVRSSLDWKKVAPKMVGGFTVLFEGKTILKFKFGFFLVASLPGGMVLV